MITLNLLGTPQILQDGEPILLSSAKAQALLIYLALEPRTHFRLAVAGLLWPEKGDGEALTNLRQAIYALRQLFPSLLVTTRTTVGVTPKALPLVDSQRFVMAAHQGASGDVEALQAAAELYRGDFLAGFHVDDASTFEEWMVTTREGLHKVAFQTLQQLTAYYVDNREPARGLPYAMQLIQLEPWQEESHYQLMQLLAWNGQFQPALAQFERCRHLLSTELQSEPGPKMLALVNAIQQGTVDIVPRPIRYQAPAVALPHALSNGALDDRQRQQGQHRASTTLPHHNLPLPPATFVGRTAALHNLREWFLAHLQTPALPATRLVTLLGPGGVGKTRLALELARELLPHFPDGVWFVDLATLHDPALILQTIASIFAVHEKGDQTLLDTLCRHLADRMLLLIFDNCEHLIEDCATLLQRLLTALPTLQVLATSRQPLHIRDERRFPVAPLSLPLGHLPASSHYQSEPTLLLNYEAIRLFVERAARIVSGYTLTHENCAAVVQICHALDGLPLAIELVAARTLILTVEQIAEQLRIEPGAQLQLATGNRTSTVARHQTLRSLIVWSYQLLSSAEQRLFQRLALFVGGCTYSAVQAVCTDVEIAGQTVDSVDRTQLLDLLAGLVEKSLVVAEAVGPVMRYYLLESIRQFVLEELRASGDEMPLRHRYVTYFAAFTESLQASANPMPRSEWLATIRVELDNLRAALECATAAQATVAGLRIAINMGRYWFSQGFHRESIRWLERALQESAAQAPEELQLTALTDLAFIYWWIVEDYAHARTLQQKALQLAQTLGNTPMIEKLLNNLGGVATRLGDFPAAHTYLRQSAELSAQSGNRLSHAWSHILLGDVAQAEGEQQAAKHHFLHAVTILEPLRARSLLAYPVRRLGQTAQAAHDYVEALAYYRTSLQLNHEMDEPEGICASLVSIAHLSAEVGEWQQAIELCAVIDQSLQSEQIRLPYVERMHYAALLAHLRQRVETTKFGDAWAQGHRCPVAKMVAHMLQWDLEKVTAITVR